VTTRIGISGWRYAGWRGKFYPDGLPQRLELQYAAGRFNSIELNGSFYSLQRPESYVRWRDDVPDDFVFAVKGGRYITHMLKLKEPKTALANFFASGLFELRHKLGPILWQFPPQFGFDAGRIQAFFDLLPRTGADAAKLARRHDKRVTGRARLTVDPSFEFRHAMEVRHPSFEDPAFIALLRRNNVALVVADTAKRWPLMEDVTADFVYVRLHGDKELYVSGYTPKAIGMWAEKVEAWRRGGQAGDARTVSEDRPPRRKRDVYVYFDNDAKVYAPRDAKRLARRLAGL
jgi:uncharacterized protein YecE (DUF72 family)